jgi:tetratricopeptide (TPR) repeat protein
MLPNGDCMIFRAGLCFALLFPVAVPVSSALAQAPVGGKADAVYLGTREPDRVEENVQPASLLCRELVRQAFLIAARDECGLLTRDATLREGLPKSAGLQFAQFDLECKAVSQKTSALVYALYPRGDDKAKAVWEWKFPCDPNDPETIAKLAEQIEPLSRGALKTVLDRAGSGKSVPAARAAAAVPAQAEDELWEFNELALVDALRRIHAEIRSRGESPELLAALCVGYANLGSLTEYHYSAAHKAYSARALVYAERLLQKDKRSSWGLWHRAYARALLGLHQLALADVLSAKKLREKAAGSRPLPFWTGILDAFCQGRLPQMVKEATSPKGARLAAYLNLEAVLYSRNAVLIAKACDEIVQKAPDCLRANDAYCIPRQLGVMGAASGESFESFGRILRAHVAKLDHLPGATAKSLQESHAEAEAEVNFRGQLISQLKAEADSGRDRAEPSLAAVAQMIDEIEFAQLIRRLQFDAQVLAVPIQDTVSLYRPLCEHHPDAALIDTFGTTPTDVREAIGTLAKNLDLSALGYPEAFILRPLRGLNETRIGAWLQIVFAHSDAVFGDEMLGLQSGSAGQKPSAEYMENLWKTSSKLPAAVAVRIEHDWRHARPEAAATEKAYRDDPIVMNALLQKYVSLEQFEDAERCAQRLIEIAPDYAAYKALANIYSREGQQDRWEKTLRESLKLPAGGLEQSQVHNQLAKYHMERNEWQKAVADADAGAQSGAAWAMVTAARCHEMLGEWDQAEGLMRSTSERYENQAFAWMLWCFRTGHGDANAADECARKRFEALDTKAPPVMLDRIGAYYLLRKEPEKALAVFDKSYGSSRSAFSGMHAAIVADSLGKERERDDYLTKIVDGGKNLRPRSVGGVYARLAELMQQGLPPGNIKDFDYAQVDSILRAASKNPRPGEANLSYFVGAFLKNRGAADQAQEYLLRCARSRQYGKFNYSLACQILRELKIPVPLPNGVDLSDEEAGNEASGSQGRGARPTRPGRGR